MLLYFTWGHKKKNSDNISIHTVHRNLCECFIELKILRHTRNLSNKPPIISTAICFFCRNDSQDRK